MKTPATIRIAAVACLLWTAGCATSMEELNRQADAVNSSGRSLSDYARQQSFPNSSSDVAGQRRMCDKH